MSQTEKPLQAQLTIPSNCMFSNDIYSSDGYVKSLCTLCTTIYKKGYASHQDTCLKNGMRLFRPDSSEGISTALRFLTKYWPSSKTMFYIEGRNGSSCSTISNNVIQPISYVMGKGDCNLSFYILCEYKLANADPLMAPIETPKTCKTTSVVNKASGIYHKSICIVETNMNSSAAKTNCLSNGMQLFDADDSDESRNALLSFANKNWQPKSGRTFFIKGFAGKSCAYIYNKNGKFVDGFGSCDKPGFSICQFLDIKASTTTAQSTTQTTKAPIPTTTTAAQATLKPEDYELLSNISTLFNYTIAPEDQVEAIANYKAAAAKVAENNKLFKQGLSGFETEVYWFDLLPESKKNVIFGGSPPEPNEPEAPANTPLLDIDGNVVDFSANRRKRASPASIYPECNNLPASKNWALEGKTSPIQNQGSCASCYLFAALSVLESKVAIVHDTPTTKLSAQHSLECVKNFTGDSSRNACQGGGSPKKIWSVSEEQNGVVLDSAYTPYNQNPNGPCVAGLTKDDRAEVDFWQTVANGDEEAMKCSVALFGPLTVTIMALGSFQSFKSGVWDDRENSCAVPGNLHMVSVVGYDSTIDSTGAQVDYWILQNSWGKRWGMSGFINYKRGVNLCGIATEASYPVLKRKSPLRPIFTPTNAICPLLYGTVYSFSGVYLKSFCVDNQLNDYENAKKACNAKGMRLYTLDTKEASLAITIAMSQKFTLSLKTPMDLFIYTPPNANDCKTISNGPPLVNFQAGTKSCKSVIRRVCEYIDYDSVKPSPILEEKKWRAEKVNS